MDRSEPRNVRLAYALAMAIAWMLFVNRRRLVTTVTALALAPALVASALIVHRLSIEGPGPRAKSDVARDELHREPAGCREHEWFLAHDPALVEERALDLDEDGRTEQVQMFVLRQDADRFYFRFRPDEGCWTTLATHASGDPGDPDSLRVAAVEIGAGTLFVFVRDGLRHWRVTRGMQLGSDQIPDAREFRTPDGTRHWIVTLAYPQSWDIERIRRYDTPSELTEHYLVTEHRGALSDTLLEGASLVRVRPSGQVQASSRTCGPWRVVDWTWDGAWRPTRTRTGSPATNTCGTEHTSFALLEDLDGDGDDERVLVRQGRRVTECEARIVSLSIDETTVFRAHDSEDPPVLVEARIVDVDERDGRRELVVVRRDSAFGSGADVIHLFGLEGAQIRESRIERTSASDSIYYAQLTFDGSGHAELSQRVGLTYSGCDEGCLDWAVVRDRWTWRDGRLAFDRALSFERESPDPLPGDLDAYRAMHPNEQPACPYVYVGGEHVGEILRNLRATELEAWQGLALPRPDPSARTLTVRLLEAKPETTYLDSVRLRVDDALIEPVGCSGPEAPAHCDDDGEYSLLRTGDALELTFELPRSVTSGLELIANGYYLPDA